MDETLRWFITADLSKYEDKYIAIVSILKEKYYEKQQFSPYHIGFDYNIALDSFIQSGSTRQHQDCLCVKPRWQQ
jgi:hypothetical protein